jgi:hypothetical protein
MPVTLPVFEESLLGGLLCLGEHEFSVAPNKGDIVHTVFEGSVIALEVLRIEHKASSTLIAPLEKRLFSPIVVGMRVAPVPL